MIINSDAFLQGWGACCQEQTTGGAWSQLTLHINCLELLAATLADYPIALQSFAKNEFKVTILLRIDNTTAVDYINHLGEQSPGSWST